MYFSTVCSVGALQVSLCPARVNKTEHANRRGLGCLPGQTFEQRRHHVEMSRSIDFVHVLTQRGKTVTPV